MIRTSAHTPLLVAVLLGAVAVLAATVGNAGAEPAAVADQRAKVAALQAELNAVGAEVERAAEAYNGARYRLGVIEDDLATTKRDLRQSARNLTVSEGRLRERLVSIYVRPTPSVTTLLLTSDSLSEATSRIDLLQQVASSDAEIVTAIKDQRTRLAGRQAELAEGRKAAAVEVASAEKERARVESLLARRQSVLSSAEAGLRRAVAAEQARARREAERQRAAAAARAAATPNASPAPAPQETASDTPDPAPAPALPDASGNARAAQIALQYLGVPYVWGGASPSGFDCSGLISYAYGQIGKSVPHYTGAIWNAFPQVPSGSLQPGDAVFFRSDLGHAGIYIGSGRYVHAPQTGDVVKISSISDRSDYQGAVRP